MLGALAQEHRLALFRLLVRQGPDGYAAGEIAARLGVPPPTLSFHLKALEQVGLVSARRSGRFVYYSADFGAMDVLVGFLTENCCGRPAQRAARCLPPAVNVRQSTGRRRA